MKKVILSILLAALMLILPTSSAFAYEGTVTVDEVDFPEIDLNSGQPIKGVDVSSYFSLKNSGVVYRDFDGNILSDSEYFDFLSSCGINYIRVRIWNDPYDSNGNGYGGGNCDLDNAVKIGKLATGSGMKLLADFHLSDFWSDPSTQRAPKEWNGYSLAQKESAVYSYVYDSLTTLKNEGVDVGMVQIGNEINTGLCGETSQTNIAKLVKSGADAVNAVDSGILKAVHYTNPESNDYLWFAKNLEQNGVEYDVFASSYYPYWHGSLENLTSRLKEVADGCGKYVMCAETSYPFTTDDSDFYGNSVSGSESTLDYPVSVQGQANALRDVFHAVANVGEKGIGVFYWEPAWITVGTSSYYENLDKWETYGSGWESSYAAEYCGDGAEYHGGSSWDNQALFDKNGSPLDSLMTFKLIGGESEPETKILIGDVDGDGVISVKDATAIQEHIVELREFSDEAKIAADVNTDGIINIRDATCVQLYVVERPDNNSSCGKYI